MKKFSSQQIAIVALGALTTLLLLPINGAPAATRLVEAGQQVANNILQKPQVNLELTAQQPVKTKEGQITWQKLDAKTVVQPGSSLRFEVKANNVGDRAAKSFSLTQPVAQGTEYQLGSVSTNAKAQVVFSIDNGKTFVASPQVSVQKADGRVAMEPAPASSYTHVRWNFEQALEAKAQQQMAYEVRVK
jgi:uncharacterized repeat protein (TIGR01451 family)